MSDDWQYFPCSMGDDQAFIFLDVGIYDTIAEAPHSLARVILTYKAPNPDGLPTSDEFDSGKGIEERISDHAKAADDWYVGRATVAGQRLFYVYTNQTEQSWSQFLTTLSSGTGYELQLEYRDDPNHTGYRDDIYPTADDWQVIKDLRVIENLESHGDDGSDSRKVDHWVYLSDKASSVDFIVWAENDRFTEESECSHVTDDGKYCVRLFHQGTMKIGDISSHTIALRRKAAEFGGDYDGWETPIIKPGDTTLNQQSKARPR